MGKNIIWRKILSMVGAAVGSISIYLGLIVSNMSTGGYEINIEYGGDAYTGIQNAAAQTANNVMYLAKIVKTGAACILIVLGLAMICFFVIKFISLFEKKNDTLAAGDQGGYGNKNTASTRANTEYKLPEL